MAKWAVKFLDNKGEVIHEDEVDCYRAFNAAKLAAKDVPDELAQRIQTETQRIDIYEVDA